MECRLHAGLEALRELVEDVAELVELHTLPGIGSRKRRKREPLPRDRIGREHRSPVRRSATLRSAAGADRDVRVLQRETRAQQAARRPVFLQVGVEERRRDDAGELVLAGRAE